MNLTSARDELAARGFDGLTQDPGRMNLFLNAGKNALENYAPWPWLESVISGTAPLTISDLKTVTFVYRTAPNLAIDGSERGHLRAMYGPDLSRVGTACFWYLEGMSTMKVFPVDTTTINVDYIKVSPELSSDTDEPEWPDVAGLNQAWMDLSAAEAYMDADEYSAAQTCIQKAENNLARQLDVYFGRNLQNPQAQTLTFASEDW